MLAHKGTKTLISGNLILRKFSMEDAHNMFNNWASDSEVTKYLSWLAHNDINITKNVLGSWIKNYENPEYYQWAIEIKKSREVIGSITVVNIDSKVEMCEIGYCIGKAFWNKGIMTEALELVIRFCFNEVGFNRVMARHHIGNPASGRVMEKCRFKYEGLLRQVMKNNRSEFVDCKYYSILKEEYDG